MTRHFLTSCDVGYAARAVAMIGSLWKWCPDASITVLCLDERTGPMLEETLGDRVSIVTIPILIDAEPRLEAVRKERGLWEFYATLKPFILLRELDLLPPDESLGFLDSDTFFFSNPDPVFVELKNASIGISPHRFSKEMAHLSEFGNFNAGFGLWRNNPIGRKCLLDWSAECLDWCYARTDGPRFMNQGYLSAWPERYTDLVVLQHPGANVGPWNADFHRFESGPDGVLVDGLPLIFFHFSSIFRAQDGRWKIHDFWPALRSAFVLREIFRPYLSAIDRWEGFLNARFGIEARPLVRSRDESMPLLDLKTIPVESKHGQSGCRLR